MSLRAFCKKRVSTISPERSIAEACWLMKDKNIGCLVVESHDKLCGILTDRDIAMKVTGEERDPLTTMVEEVMTWDPVCISVDQDLPDLISLMQIKQVRRIPIMDSLKTVLGIVTMDDLIALLGNEISQIGKLESKSPQTARWVPIDTTRQRDTLNLASFYSTLLFVNFRVAYCNESSRAAAQAG